MKVSTVLDQIDNGQMALPEFQRGYVWRREQVRGLMSSLYRRYPVGSLLSWTTDVSAAGHRGDQRLSAGAVNLLLDGQQRITSLYGIIRGKPPAFFDGDASAFADLYFNVASEEFSFYMPSRMKNDPLWISVTDLMINGAEAVSERLAGAMELNFRDGNRYISRLNRLRDVRDIDIHIEQISGEDKTLDIVVEIFNRVNSGGTKLSKGDLALARICSTLPDARRKMRDALDDWHRRGFNFSLDWLLRSVTTLTTDEARFSAIHDIDAPRFLQGLEKAVRYINHLLDLIGARLGLDHHQVLTGHFAFPVLVRYLHEQGGELRDQASVNKLLFWYIHAAIWGRYSGSTESVLGRDLKILLAHRNADPLGALVHEMLLWRGSLRVRPDNFAGHSRGNRFYSLLYLLTRVGEAIDWGLGIPLRKGLLGHNTSLELHHIFPKHRLREHGYDHKQVNALANFCFLTKGSNLSISNRLPEDYLPEIEGNHPGSLASQWVPEEQALWALDAYPAFLKARRDLLAQATNALLDALYRIDADTATIDSMEAEAVASGGIASEEDEVILRELQDWMASQNLPRGELEHELIDSGSGDPIAFLDLAWPEGLQPGMDTPTALVMQPNATVLGSATNAGYRVFDTVQQLKRHVADHILSDPFVLLPDWASNATVAAVPIIEHIVDRGLPAPQVGYEVLDVAGAVALELELAWPEHRIGIHADRYLSAEAEAAASNWRLFSLEDVSEMPTVLGSALRG